LKRLQHILVVAAIIASAFTVTSARAAVGPCVLAEFDGPGYYILDAPLGHSVTYTFSIHGVPTLGPITVNSPGPGYTTYVVGNGEHFIIVDNDTECEEPEELPETQQPQQTAPLFTDGRVNKNDALQTAAVYCDKPNAGDVQIYVLIDNKGYLAFTVTKAELAAGVQKPATPYLIKSAKGAELWRLQDGSLRIKRGTYVFDWPGC
jgi:hypothetical protein